MRIVVLGAGYAGLSLVRRLDRWLGAGSPHPILLLDRSLDHQLIVRMHEVAAASIPPEAAPIPIPRVLRGTRVEFRQAEAAVLRLDERRVVTDHGATEYDILVVALGGETDDFGLPGIREHALPLRGCADATRLARHVERQVVRARRESDPVRRQMHLTVAVGGGGYSGTELAGEILYRLRDLVALHGVPASPQVVLVEARDQLLPGFPADAARRAEEILAGLGVEVRLRAPVAGAQPGALLLRSGESIQAGTVVWAGGVRAHPLVAQSGIPVGAGGRALVDEFLRWGGRPGLFAIGDTACMVEPGTGRPAAASAQVAIGQADHLAHSLYRLLSGRPPAAYRPHPTPEVVSLGRRHAIAAIGGAVLTGVEARILKALSYRRYQASVGAA